jgi:hypothetical protein
MWRMECGGYNVEDGMWGIKYRGWNAGIKYTGWNVGDGM